MFSARIGSLASFWISGAVAVALLLGCGAGAAPKVPPAGTDAGGGANVAPPPVEPSSRADARALPVDDSFFVTRMATAHVPGAAVAIVKNGNVVWSKGYGYAVIEQKQPASPDTLFMIASISKTFVGVALMQLIERSPSGLVMLDQDINGALPFAVRNPAHPTIPITYRMLLTHTSSLDDGPIYQELQYSQGDYPTPLGSFLSSYVEDAQNWSTAAPGTEFSYSNAAASIAGLLVERLSGASLQQYSSAAIFAPLGMTESSWFLAPLDPSHIAMPYEFNGSAYVPQGQYGYPDYPSGQLRTSANQLARFLGAIMEGGIVGATRILSGASMAEMLRVQLSAPNDDQGLVFYTSTSGSTPVIGHSGIDFGVSTDMWFDPSTSAGYVLLTNGSTYQDGSDPEIQAFDEMNAELLRLAQLAK
jgi:CubicO group peptidase (beta-lactamase class C family)